MVSPYREQPLVLLCPRCGEVLEPAFDGVFGCLRCEGIWIEQPVLDEKFGATPRWPVGSNAWWRRELSCPGCACEGKASTMDAVIASDVIVDRCPSHGVWLDQGELGRLLGSSESDGISAIYKRLKGGTEVSPSLAKKRAQREAEAARRERENAEFRATLDVEQRERAESSAAEARAAREREAAAARAAAAYEVAQRELAAKQAAHAAERVALAARRASAVAEVKQIEAKLVSTRDAVFKLEDQLAGAYGRLRALDDRLATLTEEA